MLAIALLAALEGPLVGYDVKESVTATTPRGHEAHAFVGRVTVAGERAVWALAAGRFPRSSAEAAVADRSGITLLDRKEGIYASATREDFDALFVPRAGAETGASFTPRNVTVSVVPDGAGASFGDVPTVRWRVTASWQLAIEAPGRAGSITTKMSGTIVAAPALACSPFDDPLRLLPVRGSVREAFADELRKVAGLPVHVDLELVSESQSERLGAAPGPPETGTKIPKSVTRIWRELSSLERRPAREADARLFEVPQAYHSRALERLAPADALP